MNIFDELKKVNFPNNLLIVLSLLIIIVYPSGPFLPDLFLSISVLIFIYYAIKTNNIKYFKNTYSLFFLIFFIYIVTNSFFAMFPKVSLLSSFFYIRFYLFSLVVWYLFENEKIFKILLYKVLLIVILFINFDTLLQYFIGFDLFGYDSLSHRLSGPFGDELIVGSYLSKSVPVLLALGYFIDKKNYNLLFAILSLSVLTTFLSGERTAFFMISVFYAFFLIITIKKENLVKILLSIFIIFLAVSISLVSDKSRFDRMVKYPICAMNLDYLSLLKCKNENEPTPSDSDLNKRPILFSEAHEGHYKSALKMFLDEPIFGKGIKMYRYYCDDPKYKNPHSCTTHPHNILLQVLAELGVVGLLFLLIILYKIYKTLFVTFINKKKIHDSVGISFLIINFLLIQLFFLFLPSGQIFNNYLSILYFLPLGIYFSLEKKSNTNV